MRCSWCLLDKAPAGASRWLTNGTNSAPIPDAPRSASQAAIFAIPRRSVRLTEPSEGIAFLTTLKFSLRILRSVGSVMETTNQPEDDPECQVAVIDADGKLWTMPVRARSLYAAVCVYHAQQISGIYRHFPRLERDTEVEVRLSDGRVLRTTGKCVWDWANREAERRNS